MPTKEILTLQFGHYANFVGTHLWNIQETGFEYEGEEVSGIDHRVLYREGFTKRGETTFTPRLLLCDLKNSLKTLPQEGDLYDLPLDPAQLHNDWHKVEIDRQPPPAKNDFQQDLATSQTTSKRYNFEEEVQVWSDFMYARYHPRTVNVIKEYEHCNLETPFDSFTLGRDLWKGFGEEFEDRIRSYVEECDYLQGFQVLTDCTNGFSGLSSACLEHIADDYHKSILVLPCIPSHFGDNDFVTPQEQVYSIMNDSTRVINSLLSFNKFREWGNMFVPLCAARDGWRQPGPGREFYHCSKFQPKLPYHSSALLAAAIDTFTLKYRLKSSFSLMDLSADLTLHGRKAVAASLCLPFSLNSDADLIDCLDKWEGPLTQSITPKVTIGSDRQMQHLFLRGVPETRLKSSLNLKNQRDMPAYQCKTVQEMLSYYYSCTSYASANSVATLPKGMPTKTPFPELFDDILQINGTVGFSPRPSDLRVDSIPVLAGLHNGVEMGEMLQSLHDEARKLKIRRFKQFSLDCDEYEENLEDMLSFRENYEDSYLV